MIQIHNDDVLYLIDGIMLRTQLIDLVKITSNPRILKITSKDNHDLAKL